jgi:HSP20 family protein
MITTFANPFDALLSLQRALEAQLTSDWLQDSTTSRGAFPPINVFQQGEDLLAIIELPGIDKNDMQIQAKENTNSYFWEEGCRLPRRRQRAST